MRAKCSFQGCEKDAHGQGLCAGHHSQRRAGKTLRPLRPKNGKIPPNERFLAFLDKSGDCWTWTGCINNKGYGVMRISGTAVLSHRFAYEQAFGPIPPGMVIDHTCHVPPCCNPKHLRAATQKQNCENQLGALRTSRSGFRGVETHKNGTYSARVKHNGVRYHGGTFNTPEEAAEAARQLRLSLFTHNDADRRTA